MKETIEFRLNQKARRPQLSRAFLSELEKVLG
jgi:hypothetical protein